MSAESWRKKAETLEFSNTRLKEEAVKREEQITQIKTKFRSIVEELKKRELPDGSTAVQGGGGRDDADVQLGLQERRIKELARKLAAAHKASQDAGKLSDEWERKYRQQLRRASVPGRSTSPSVAQRKDDAKHSDLWKRKYMDLQQSLKKEGGASKVQTVRALRPRKVPYNAEPMEVGHEASRSPTTSPQAEFLSRQPVLMNAWVQTAGWEPEERIVVREVTRSPRSPVLRSSPVHTPRVQILETTATTATSPQTQSLLPEIHDNSKNLVDALRRENLNLQCRIEEVLNERNSLDSKLKLLAHERNALAARELDRGGAIEDILELKHELTEKNAKLVLLDARFTQAQNAVDGLKGNQGDLILELEKMNAKVADANGRALAADNALQVASLTQGRVEGVEERLRDRDEEVRLLNAEIERLMQKCHSTRTDVMADLKDEWGRQVDERQHSLEEAERNNKQLFREVAAVTQQRDELHDTWLKVQKERDALDMETIKLRGECTALRDRVKLFGPDHQVDDEEDVHKALALIQHHKRRGDPTDLEFLIKAWDVGDKELSDLRGENITLSRELEIARKMLEARQERIELDHEKMSGLKHAAEAKNQLLENMGDKLRRLTDDMVQYRGVGKKLSTDSDASSVAAGDNENVLELSLGHLALAESLHDSDVPPSFFFCIDFLDFETVVTETLSGRSVTFSRTFCFTLEVTNALRHYIQHKEVPFELHQAIGLGHELVGRGFLSLKGLLAPALTDTRGHCDVVDAESNSIANVEFALRLKRPLPLEWVGLPKVVHDDREVGLVYALRHIRALKLVVHECRSLVCSPTPMPYVLVAPMSTVITDKTYLEEVNVEMQRAEHTTNPVFRHTHEYDITVDAAAAKYLKSAVLNFVVLDDASLDPTTPPIGKASLALAPLLEGSAASIDSVLELSDQDNKPTGSIVVTMKWVKSFATQPLYIEGL